MSLWAVATRPSALQGLRFAASLGLGLWARWSVGIRGSWGPLGRKGWACGETGAGRLPGRHALVARISQTLPGSEGSGEWAGGCSPTTGCGCEGCGCGQEGGAGFGDGVAVLDVVYE